MFEAMGKDEHLVRLAIQNLLEHLQNGQELREDSKLRLEKICQSILKGNEIYSRAERGWRLSGFALLLLSLLLVLQHQQLAEDLVARFGILTMAALLVASVLAYRQRS